MNNTLRVTLLNRVKNSSSTGCRLLARKLTHYIDSVRDSGTSSLTVSLFITITIIVVILFNVLPKRIRAWIQRRRQAAGKTNDGFIELGDNNV
jgi:uncharacterized protein HemY